ncbi:MAG: trehalose-phosphatase [candidate division Zixibacteria bacterium]|nr:trehalose-phosphatase [candidate division Zixibacteria bacterium]
MKILKPGFILDNYFRALTKAENRALLLDYDGTLAPFKTERDKAIPYPDAIPILDNLIESDKCRVVIISGRRIDDLLPLLNLKNLPEIWGSHGWERLMPDKTYHVFDFGKQAIKGLAEAENWLVKEALQSRYENKPGCLALHWRGLPDDEAKELSDKANEHWSPIAAGSGLEIHVFNNGVELRASGRNKGYAVKKIISETGKCMITYMGDDYTDEDAFGALNSTGLGVLVSDKLRETAAGLWVKPPDEMLDFLKMWEESVVGGEK